MAEFQEVMRQRKKLCAVYNCIGCPVYKANGSSFCGMFMVEEPEKFEAVVMKWAAEHPEKTMKDALFEKFPNAVKGLDGTPYICVTHVGFKKPKSCAIACPKCWSRPAPEGY